MLRFIAILFGIAFIFAGIAGYMPTFIHDGLLFGYFEVNRIQNIVHLITGVIAIMAATSYRMTKIFFSVFGIIYTIIGVWGFWQEGNLILLHTNMADNIFHVVVGVIALYFGFSKRRRAQVT